MAKFNDLTGQSFGRLTVIERAENHILPNGKPRTMWLCQCQCGNYTTVSSQSLTNGTTVSCGCQQRENFRKPIRDMTGQRFGKLLVLGYSRTKVLKSNNHKIIWKCRCDCGNEVEVEGYQLRVGKTQSCGCTKSRGEELIAKILKDHKINFIQNKRNDKLRLQTGGYPLFDFQIIDQDKLIAVIEMQGIQHYEEETETHCYRQGKTLRQHSARSR